MSDSFDDYLERVAANPTVAEPIHERFGRYREQNVDSYAGGGEDFWGWLTSLDADEQPYTFEWVDIPDTIDDRDRVPEALNGDPIHLATEEQLDEIRDQIGKEAYEECINHAKGQQISADSQYIRDRLQAVYGDMEAVQDHIEVVPLVDRFPD